MMVSACLNSLVPSGNSRARRNSSTGNIQTLAASEKSAGCRTCAKRKTPVFCQKPIWIVRVRVRGAWWYTEIKILQSQTNPNCIGTFGVDIRLEKLDIKNQPKKINAENIDVRKTLRMFFSVKFFDSSLLLLSLYINSPVSSEGVNRTTQNSKTLTQANTIR